MTRDWLCAHIPHAGAMCLLAGVESWDAQRIVCRADSHRLADHPLRSGGRLSMVHGVEYAAQAMAVHSALLAHSAGKPAIGYLASVRDTHWFRARLDDVQADVWVQAERISGDERMVLYRFELTAERERLLTGRASVLIDAGRVGTPMGAGGAS